MKGSRGEGQTGVELVNKTATRMGMMSSGAEGKAEDCGFLAGFKQPFTHFSFPMGNS